MSYNVRNYFIASAETYEVKAFDGDIFVPEDTVVWLAMHDGYPQCSMNKDEAYRFGSAYEIRNKVKAWDGMPWCYVLKLYTLKIYRVTEEIQYTRTETEWEEE